MPSATAHLAIDAPKKLANAIASFLGDHPEALFETSADRRPEILGIRPLPEYASLEEAMKVQAPQPLALCSLCLLCSFMVDTCKSTAFKAVAGHSASPLDLID